MVRDSRAAGGDASGGGPRLHHALVRHARAAARAAADFLLPRGCVVCERLLDAGDHGPVCARCWNRARALPHPQCERCGHPRRPGRCTWCELLPPYVRAVRSACWLPGGTAAAIVHALKYDGWTAIADAMALRMARLAWPGDVIRERTAVVPVPLAAPRERERGFNQSERLARALAVEWHCPMWSSALERRRATATQTRLTPEDRRRNVFGAFRALPTAREALRGAHIVLVDDVITTGATLSACAAALLSGGARIISYVTFGRAPASGDRI